MIALLTLSPSLAAFVWLICVERRANAPLRPFSD